MHIRFMMPTVLIALVLASSPVLAQTPAAVDPAYERILIPVAGSTLRSGAAGSRWESSVTLTNLSDVPVLVKGYTHPAGCGVAMCDNLDPIPPRQTLSVAVPALGNSIGAFLTIVDANAADLAVSQRVRDLSRGHETWGTVLPVVSLSQFRTGIAINDVPVGPDFRNLLRVYADEPTVVTVRVYRIDPSRGLPGPTPFDAPDKLLSTQPLSLTRDFAVTPSSGQMYLGDTPGATVGDRLRLEVTASLPVWAFVSTTHNATQHVTIASPLSRP